MSDNDKSKYLQYLPAVFQEDPFLERFLLPFEDVLTSFEHLLGEVDRYFSPGWTSPVPSAASGEYPEFLRWLANWVALVLDEQWDEAKQRRLIGEAVALYRQRGTVQGLKRYLEIYTGIEPEIREPRWPGGMQIGVASIIGGDINENWTRLPPEGVDSVYVRWNSSDDHQIEYHDYYIVETRVTNNHPPEVSVFPTVERVRYYYRADNVTRVDVNGTKVTITRLGGDTVDHFGSTISRQDAVRHDTYSIHFSEKKDGSQENLFLYEGNTILIDEVEMPYRFIVDVKVPALESATGDTGDPLDETDLRAVRAIVDLEKPAHTKYFLKLTRVEQADTLSSMQIEVQATIGLDTTVGLDPGRKVWL